MRSRLLQLIKNVLKPYRKKYGSIFCRNLGHIWTCHAPGRHCRICTLSYKEYSLAYEKAMNQKECESCRYFQFCWADTKETNPWRHDCLAFDKCHFEIRELKGGDPDEK